MTGLYLHFLNASITYNINSKNQFKEYLANTWSQKVFGGPVRRVSLISIISFTQSRYEYRRSIPASAIASTKLASSIPSPASAREKRMPFSNRKNRSQVTTGPNPKVRQFSLITSLHQQTIFTVQFKVEKTLCQSAHITKLIHQGFGMT